jgi:hypothetical protein
MNCRVCLFNLTILLCRNENVAEAAGHKLLGARILPTLLGDDEFKWLHACKYVYMLVTTLSRSTW